MLVGVLTLVTPPPKLGQRTRPNQLHPQGGSEPDEKGSRSSESGRTRSFRRKKDKFNPITTSALAGISWAAQGGGGVSLWAAQWCVYILMGCSMMCVYPHGLLSGVCISSWAAQWCVYILMGCSVVCVYPYGLLNDVCISSWAALWCVYILMGCSMMCVYPYGLLNDVCISLWAALWCVYILMGCSMMCVYPYGLLSDVFTSFWGAM